MTTNPRPGSQEGSRAVPGGREAGSGGSACWPPGSQRSWPRSWAISVWRLRSLDGIPDVGDPFDVTAAMRPVEIPDEENAYVLYGEAHAQLTRLPPRWPRSISPRLTWSKSGQAVRDYLEQNRAAMETWRQGSERPDAIYHQPGEMTIDTLLPLVQDMRTLVHLGGLEGTRLEEQGAMDRAWDWYRAMLRCSRMVGRHGVLLERGVGSALHKEAAGRIVTWAADSRVDARMLRRALDDTLSADALTPPTSKALELEYLMYLRDMRELRVLTDRDAAGRRRGRAAGSGGLIRRAEGPDPADVAPRQQRRRAEPPRRPDAHRQLAGSS